MDEFIFDSNIFDKVVDGEIELEEIKREGNKYFVTHVQFDELSKTGNELRKQQLLSTFSNIEDENVPTESFVLGVSRLGGAKLSDGNFMEKLRIGNPNHTNDALIGEVAIKNNLVLVSEDGTFRNRVKSNGGKAISFEEFKEMVKE